jgi:hypothetical protein
MGVRRCSQQWYERPEAWKDRQTDRPKQQDFGAQVENVTKLEISKGWKNFYNAVALN